MVSLILRSKITIYLTLHEHANLQGYEQIIKK